MALTIDATQAGPSLPDPGWSECDKVGHDPRYLGQFAGFDVDQHTARRRDHVFIPVFAETNVPDGLVCRKFEEVVAASGSVIAPRHALLVQQIGGRHVIEAGIDTGQFCAIRSHQGGRRPRSRVAAPHRAVGILDHFSRLPGDHVLVRHKAGPGIGLEHAVADHILLGQRPVLFHIFPGNVRVRQQRAGLCEAIHLSVVPIFHPPRVRVAQVA